MVLVKWLLHQILRRVIPWKCWSWRATSRLMWWNFLCNREEFERLMKPDRAERPAPGEGVFRASSIHPDHASACDACSRAEQRITTLESKNAALTEALRKIANEKCYSPIGLARTVATYALDEASR